MSTIACHDKLTKNHAEVLPDTQWVIETFLDLRDYYVLYLLHKVQLAENVKAQHVLDPDNGYQR